MWVSFGLQVNLQNQSDPHQLRDEVHVVLRREESLSGKSDGFFNFEFLWQIWRKVALQSRSISAQLRRNWRRHTTTVTTAVLPQWPTQGRGDRHTQAPVLREFLNSEVKDPQTQWGKHEVWERTFRERVSQKVVRDLKCHEHSAHWGLIHTGRGTPRARKFEQKNTDVASVQCEHSHWRKQVPFTCVARACPVWMGPQLTVIMKFLNKGKI